MKSGAGAETIVVGAGSSGAVIAARMTERSAREVLLVEAGPDYPPGTALPRDLRDGTRNSMRAHDWGFRHRPGAGPYLMPLPRGRVVGGSSAVNTCIAVRGQPYDYDEWAARGLPEWAFEHCLPAFKRLESDLDFPGDRWHGSAGPIPIRRHPPSELVPWQAGFLEACGAMGFRPCPDHNRPGSHGYGPQPMNKIRGERFSAAAGYLTASVRARENLRIRPSTLVRRVVFRNGHVAGVEVESDDGRAIEVIPTRHVVLCAGAIATPAILLRSGIGPRRELERLGVECVADVPAVGARILDHPGSAIFLLPKRGLRVSVADPLIQTALRYTSRGSAYRYDIQVQAGSHVPILDFEHPVPLVTLMCQVGKPRGAGRIVFPSADVRARPRIESELLVHPDDLARATEALELMWLLASSSPLREMAEFLWPNERVLADRGRLSAWAARNCGSGYHPCGTVPMGPAGDRDAAVDGRGRVRGVVGLRVADASVMPTVPSANTNVPTLMIGERFGAWLRDDELVE